MAGHIAMNPAAESSDSVRADVETSDEEPLRTGYGASTSTRCLQCSRWCAYLCHGRPRVGQKSIRVQRATLRAQLETTRRQMASQRPEGMDLSGICWTASTRENHACPIDSPEYGRFTEPFAEIRARLDHAYHGHYTLRRQAVQDALIKNVLDMVPRTVRARPWVTFTAGAMGAGKSHTMAWLFDQGIFPLCDIVHIDPDLFKTALPEWDGYVQHDPLSAGFHTRHESGLCCEIAQERAMTLSNHIWIDGSLRDGGWYVKVFEHIRSRFPRYRIAIIHVVADEAIVLERAMKRGELTGRHVPEEEIRDSMHRVPEAVAQLAPLAEFVATIDSSGEEPLLTQWVCNESRTRAHYSRRFRSWRSRKALKSSSALSKEAPMESRGAQGQSTSVEHPGSEDREPVRPKTVQLDVEDHAPRWAEMANRFRFD